MNQDKQEQARHLYFAQAKTQKEIAQMLNICEKTIYNWIKRFSWDQMRQAARQAPALISENLCSQIVELQNSIARREPGLRYATAEESLVMQRLVTMLDKMKKYPGLGMNMQIIHNFRNWASTRDKNFSRDLGLYSGLFLQGYAQNGYYPYEMEFGMDKINPIDPFYKDEPMEEEPIKEKAKTAETSNVSVSLPNMPKDLPELVEGLLKEEKEGPVNSISQPTQSIEYQSTYDNKTLLLPPVKTGKTSENTEAENHDDPLRKWNLYLQKQRENDQNSFKLDPPGENSPRTAV